MLRRGCDHADLDTFSHQVPEFYARLGYTVFAELESFPAPHRRIFLRKRLAAGASAVAGRDAGRGDFPGDPTTRVRPR